MSSTRGDLNELHVHDYGDVTQGEDQLWSGRVTFTCAPYSAARELAPRRNESVHPLYPLMTAKRVTIAFVKPNAAKIHVDYEGLTNDFDEEDTTIPEVDYRPSMREVDITEHPSFEDWAGTPDAPINGIFDPRTKVFTGWLPSFQLYMITSFLFPGMTASVTTIENSEPALSQLGDREQQPTHLISAGSREWMLIGIPFRNFLDPDSGSEKWVVTREYLLSNPGGFNDLIYDAIT